jgi:hypothetical protein
LRELPEMIVVGEAATLPEAGLQIQRENRGDIAAH